MKKIYEIIGLFVYEFLGNHVVNSIPSSIVRNMFYRYILGVKCDKSVYFQMNCYLYSSRGILKIGKNTIINRKTVLDRRGNLYIGNNVNISPECCIFTAGHSIDSDDFVGIKKSVSIEDYVWIGTRAMIMPGVTIGKGAVVLPGSIVTKNVEQMSVVGGQPAEIIEKRTSKLNYELNWKPWFM